MASLFGGSFDAQAAGDQTPRQEWFKKYDENGDQQLKGKEVKNFMHDHPVPYERFRDWCEAAKERPKQEGVTLPKDKKAKKYKCKKKHFDAPYVKAWAKAGAREKGNKPDMSDPTSPDNWRETRKDGEKARNADDLTEKELARRQEKLERRQAEKERRRQQDK